MEQRVSLEDLHAQYRAAGHWTGRPLHGLVEPVLRESPGLRISNITTSHTLRQVWDHAVLLARGLRDWGVRSGDPVVVVVAARPVDVSIVLALSMLEAVACFAPPGGTDQGVREAILRTGATVVVGPDDDSAADPWIAEGASRIGVSDEGTLSSPQQPAPRRTTPSPPGLSRADYVTFTSGSTGQPKAVLHSADTMHYSAVNSVRAAGIADGAVLGLVAMSHAAGLAFSVFAALPSGRDLVLYDGRWDALRVLRAIDEFGAVWTLSVPTHLMDLVDAARRSGWRPPSGRPFVFACGGAAVAPELVRSAQDVGVAVCRMYGLSECLGHTASSPAETVEVRASYDGTVFEGTEVIAVDPLTREHVDGIGEAGCRGPALFRGYLEHEGEDESLTPDGYFLTGDLVRVSSGRRLEVVGRVKDIIIRGGENIDPNEVETDLLEHPSVVRAAVVGYPDRRLGERVAAWIETDGVTLDRDELLEFLLGRGVPKFRVPDRVVVVADLPRNPVGKVDKKLLRTMTEGVTS